MTDQDDSILAQLNEPHETIMMFEFDSHPENKWRLELRSGNLYDDVVLHTDLGQQTIISTYRDQWGHFIGNENYQIAQEDGTRSFLNAFIECLRMLRDRNEINTHEATIIKS